MDKPEVIKHGNGTVGYWLNGKRHREDGPAVIRADGTVGYWIHGLRHREDGPAIIRANGTVEYWVNGKLIHSETLKTVEEIQRKPVVKPVTPTHKPIRKLRG